MAVAFDAASSSGQSSSGSSFTWEHQPVAAPSGVLVYTFTNADADNATAVTYGGTSLTAVSSGRAVDTAGEPGDAKAWYLGSSVPYSYRIAANGWASGTTSSLVHTAYGNGYWVGVTSTGSILYTTDISAGTWSSATSGVSTALRRVAYANGYWVAVGDSGVIRYKATDPTGSWSGATSGTTNNLVSVAYGNGYWATAGASGTIRYRATDPAGSWSGATSGTTSALNGIEYGGGYWVASINSITPIRYKATDPTGSWSAGDATALGTGPLYGAGGWTLLISGTTPSIRYTTNPTSTWTVVNISFGTGNTANAGATDGVSWAYIDTTGNGVWATSYSGPWTSFASGLATTSSAGMAVGNDQWVAAASSGVRYTNNEATPQQVVVTRTNNSNEMCAAAITVTAADDTEVAGTTLLQGDQTLAEQSISDGSTGVNSVRFAGVNSGLATINLATTTTAADTLVAGANSTAAASFAFNGRYYLVSTTALSPTASGTSIASGSTQSSTFVVAQTLIASGIPGAIQTDTQNWVIQYTVTNMATPYEMRLKLQRRNSGGTMQTESAYGTTRSADGTYTDTISWASGSFAATDQLALVWEHRRPSGTGNKSASITAGGTSYVDAPRDKRVVGVVRETTAGQGSRSVGFQATTSDDVAAVFLAVRELYTVTSIPWIVGIPIR